MGVGEGYRMFTALFSCALGVFGDLRTCYLQRTVKTAQVLSLESLAESPVPKLKGPSPRKSRILSPVYVIVLYNTITADKKLCIICLTGCINFKLSFYKNRDNTSYANLYSQTLVPQQCLIHVEQRMPLLN